MLCGHAIGRPTNVINEFSAQATLSQPRNQLISLDADSLLEKRHSFDSNGVRASSYIRNTTPCDFSLFQQPTHRIQRIRLQFWSMRSIIFGPYREGLVLSVKERVHRSRGPSSSPHD